MDGLRIAFIRCSGFVAFTLALVWAQFVESGDARLAAHLDLAIEPRMPARIYLFKNKRPFRLSPVQALLPLRVDQFYRERVWYGSDDPAAEISTKFNATGSAGPRGPAPG